MATDASFNIQSAFGVEGLIAVITGGGTGIGLMMAKALESNGATVYIVGRRLEALQKAASEHNKHGKIIPLRGDVTSHESLEEVVSAIQSQSGHINLLVNNAGVAGNVYKDRPETFASAEEFKNYFLSKETQQDFTKVFDVNVSSVWFTTLHFLPLLEAGNNTEWGRKGITSQVVTISSVAAFRRDSKPINFAYTTSKAAATHLGKTMTNLFVDFDIRSNVIAPGIFPSEMQEAIGFPPVTKSGVPLGRAGDETDIGSLILYMASRGGAYLNGNVTIVDGGRLSVFPATY